MTNTEYGVAKANGWPNSYVLSKWLNINNKILISLKILV